MDGTQDPTRDPSWGQPVRKTSLEEIAELEAAMAETTKDREETKAKNTKTIADAKEAQVLDRGLPQRRKDIASANFRSRKDTGWIWAGH